MSPRLFVKSAFCKAPNFYKNRHFIKAKVFFLQKGYKEFMSVIYTIHDFYQQTCRIDNQNTPGDLYTFCSKGHNVFVFVIYLPYLF